MIPNLLILRDELAKQGFALTGNLFDAATINALGEAIVTAPSGRTRERQGKMFALRNLLENPAVAELAASPTLRDLVSGLLGAKAFAVRGIFFDKPPEANWLVPFHQDLTIPVRERIETRGFRAWSVKEGVCHVLPPPEILARMVTVRLHLDSCDARNGALQVIPGSHRRGRLTDEEVDQARAEATPTVISAGEGDVLLMRPLLLHASSACIENRPRRVVHLEYAAEELPGALQWHSRV